MSQWEEDVIRRLRAENPGGETDHEWRRGRETTGKCWRQLWFERGWNLPQFSFICTIKETTTTKDRTHGVWVERLKRRASSRLLWLRLHKCFYRNYTLVSGTITSRPSGRKNLKWNQTQPHIFGLFCPFSVLQHLKSGKRGWKAQFCWNKFKALGGVFLSWIQSGPQNMVIFLVPLCVIRHNSASLSNSFPVFLSACSDLKL